jgi:hypothetical protein
MHETRNSIHDIWGPRTPYEGEGQWPARVDEQFEEQPGPLGAVVLHAVFRRLWHGHWR